MWPGESGRKRGEDAGAENGVRQTTGWIRGLGGGQVKTGPRLCVKIPEIKLNAWA